MKAAAALAAAALAACSNASPAGNDNGAQRTSLYQCEGCEGARERDPATLNWQGRIGPGIDRGEPLRIEGRVLGSDGRTPAAGVVIYAYQTNAEGLYANGADTSTEARRHGRLRGWVVTAADGRYAFDTIKPAPYPDDVIPAHIHLTVLEPGRPPYWIDDIVFAGEHGVTDAYARSMENRGGSGIVTLSRDDRSRWLARRDIILERHPD